MAQRYIADLPKGRTFKDYNGMTVRTTPGHQAGHYYYGTRSDGVRIYNPDYWLRAKLAT